MDLVTIGDGGSKYSCFFNVPSSYGGGSVDGHRDETVFAVLYQLCRTPHPRLPWSSSDLHFRRFLLAKRIITSSKILTPPRTPIMDPISESLDLLLSALDALEVSAEGTAATAVDTDDLDDASVLGRVVGDMDGIIMDDVADGVTAAVEYKGRCVCHV